MSIPQVIEVAQSPRQDAHVHCPEDQLIRQMVGSISVSQRSGQLRELKMLHVPSNSRLVPMEKVAQ